MGGTSSSTKAHTAKKLKEEDARPPAAEPRIFESARLWGGTHYIRPIQQKN